MPGGGGAAGSNVGGVSSLLGRNRGDASEPGDVAESPGKSSLFFVKDRVRGIGSSGDTEKVPVERRGSGGVRCAFGGPGKSGSGFRSSRVGPYPPSAAGLQGVQPLVDGINVGKGSRQNGSVPSEEGLAPRTGSVGPCPREARNRYGAVAFAPFALCGVGSKCRSGPSAAALRSCVFGWGRRRGSGRSSSSSSSRVGGFRRRARRQRTRVGVTAGQCFYCGVGHDLRISRRPADASPSFPLLSSLSIYLYLSRSVPPVLFPFRLARRSLRVSARGAAPSLPARRSASKTAPRPGLRGAPRLPAPLRVSGACRAQPTLFAGGGRLARPPRPLLSVFLGVGAFVRQRTVDSELVRTGGIRLSN